MILEPQNDTGTGKWIKPHNQKLQNFYLSTTNTKNDQIKDRIGRAHNMRNTYKIAAGTTQAK
jgi:hypothetical protein